MNVEVLNKSSLFKGIPVPLQRSPEAIGQVKLPEGTVVVSADNHWSVTEDIFYHRFPDHLRDRAPRMVDEDGAFIFHFAGKSLFSRNVTTILRMHDSVPGNHLMEPRMRAMDAEGISKELIFYNAIGAFLGYSDLEVREWIFRVYNEYLGDLQRQAPGRVYGVGLINYWQPERTAESIAEAKAQGIRAILLPINPYSADYKPLNYCDPSMEPMWQAIEDAELPLFYHVGEFSPDTPGGIGLAQFLNFGPFRKNFGELVFGGIFDRHPNLQVVFAEADINWIPGALQNADMVFDTFGSVMDPKIRLRPSEYWHKHCYATFMSDRVGLKMLDDIGADRVMWSMDYAHPESVYGAGWSSMQEVIDLVPSDDDVRKILGGNALKLFKL